MGTFGYHGTVVELLPGLGWMLGFWTTKQHVLDFSVFDSLLYAVNALAGHHLFGRSRYKTASHSLLRTGTTSVQSGILRFSKESRNAYIYVISLQSPKQGG